MARSAKTAQITETPIETVEEVVATPEVEPTPEVKVDKRFKTKEVTPEPIEIPKTKIVDVNLPLTYDFYDCYTTGSSAKQKRGVRLNSQTGVKEIDLLIDGSFLFDTGIKADEFISFNEDIKKRLELKIHTTAFIQDGYVFLLVENRARTTYTLSASTTFGKMEIKDK